MSRTATSAATVASRLAVARAGVPSRAGVVARAVAGARSGAVLAACAVALGPALVATGCGARGPEPPTMVAAAEPFEIRVPGRGELLAEKTTPIGVPQNLRGPQTVAWLAADGARLAAGDTVARLDDRQTSQGRATALREVGKMDLSIAAQKIDQATEKAQLSSQIALLGQEKSIASKYAPKDPEIFSRQEIIDAQVSLELLDTKEGLYRGKQQRQDRKHRTDGQLLALQRQTHQVRVDQADEALASVVIKAPHDGIFVRKKWRGEPVSVGTTVWGDDGIGELPDLSSMEAKINVLESEAPGLAVGIPAEVVLDAAPDRVFKAKVKTVGAVAQPIEDESPVKYFEVILSIEKTDLGLMRPGQQVSATIFVAREDKSISVPNQALFHKGDENWVFVRAGGGLGGGGFEKRAVTLGRRSLTRTIVEKGLEPGDVVALADPEALLADGTGGDGSGGGGTGGPAAGSAGGGGASKSTRGAS